MSTKTAVVKKQDNIITSTEKRISDLVSNNRLVLPIGYNVGNAIRSAYLVITDVKDSQKREALKICTPQSIANALLKMVVDGLYVEKKHCYFQVYGTSLVCVPSYFGDIMVGKRDAAVKDVLPQIIYENDVVKKTIAGGRHSISSHEQDWENVDEKKIKGAYVYVYFNDGSDPWVEIMTKAQIDNSWKRAKTKRVHESDPGEMVKRTVIKRALKPFINSSTPKFPELAENEILADKIEFGEEVQSIDFEETAQLQPAKEKPKPGEEGAPKEEPKMAPTNGYPVKKEPKEEPKSDIPLPDGDDMFVGQKEGEKYPDL